MTPAQFTRALAATRLVTTSKTVAALRLVYVSGKTKEEAAAAIGIEPSAVSRGAAKFDMAFAELYPTKPCPHCQGSGEVPA